MKRNLLILFVFFVALFFQSTSFAKDFLWVLEKGEKKVYFLGSVHLLKPEHLPLPAAFEKAYADSQTVAFETDLDAGASTQFAMKTMKMAQLENGKKITDLISPESFKKIEELLKAEGLSLRPFLAFKPSFAAISLSVIKVVKLGYKPELGVDQHFYKKSKKDKKEIVHLETPEQQLNFLLNSVSKEQEKFLLLTAQEMKNVSKMLEDLITAWKSGDAKSIYKLSKEGTTEAFYQTLLVQRNKNWIPAIEKMIKSPKNALVIVGAGHLAGTNSVIDLLRKKGYKIRQL